MKQRILLLTFLGALVTASVSLPLFAASGSQAAQRPTRVSHEVAFTCGMDPPGATSRILPGQYATAVNICNPTNRPMHVRLGVSLTFPDKNGAAEIEGGLVSEPIFRTLQPREALEVDCAEIPSQFFDDLQTPPYIQGFLLVESLRGVTVSAIYTAGQVDEIGNVRVVSIDVEQIQPQSL